MKITLFLLLLVIFQVYSGNCYSQNARVSIQNARLRVGQVLEQIESQTEYLFVYNKQNVDVRRTVDINASNQTVSEVLDQMFKGTDIKYVMEGKNIVLTKNSIFHPYAVLDGLDGVLPVFDAVVKLGGYIEIFKPFGKIGEHFFADFRNLLLIKL